MSYEQWLRDNYICPKCGKPCTVCDYECDYIVKAEDKWLKTTMAWPVNR